jgi:hypothetical protein
MDKEEKFGTGRFKKAKEIITSISFCKIEECLSHCRVFLGFHHSVAPFSRSGYAEAGFHIKRLSCRSEAETSSYSFD